MPKLNRYLNFSNSIFGGIFGGYVIITIPRNNINRAFINHITSSKVRLKNVLSLRRFQKIIHIINMSLLAEMSIIKSSMYKTSKKGGIKMKKLNDEKWLENNRWGKWGSQDEVGVLNEVTQESVVAAVQLIKTGKIYDLETVRFKGMPVWAGHSGWDLLSYASATGRQNMRESEFDPSYNWYAPKGWCDKEINRYNIGLNSEIYIGPVHVGTHIDAFCHLTAGEDNHWYNGFTEKENWSNFGPLKADGATIPPMIMRGILLDIPGYKGVDHLQPGEGIGAEDIIACAKWAGVEIKQGDAVLIRTGERWPQMDLAPGCGVTLEAARYLIEEKNVFLIGNDQAAFENFPSETTTSFPGHIHPVHHYMLIQMGVHIMEMVQLEELAKDKVYEFCFMGFPNKIRCSTGMMIRPVAVK